MQIQGKDLIFHTLSRKMGIEAVEEIIRKHWPATVKEINFGVNPIEYFFYEHQGIKNVADRYGVTGTVDKKMVHVIPAGGEITVVLNHPELEANIKAKFAEMYQLGMDPECPPQFSEGSPWMAVNKDKLAHCLEEMEFNDGSRIDDMDAFIEYLGSPDTEGTGRMPGRVLDID